MVPFEITPQVAMLIGFVVGSLTTIMVGVAMAGNSGECVDLRERPMPAPKCPYCGAPLGRNLKGCAQCGGAVEWRR
jgi:hypothetical protein